MPDRKGNAAIRAGNDMPMTRWSFRCLTACWILTCSLVIKVRQAVAKCMQEQGAALEANERKTFITEVSTIAATIVTQRGLESPLNRSYTAPSFIRPAVS